MSATTEKPTNMPNLTLKRASQKLGLATPYRLLSSWWPSFKHYSLLDFIEQEPSLAIEWQAALNRPLLIVTRNPPKKAVQLIFDGRLWHRGGHWWRRLKWQRRRRRRQPTAAAAAAAARSRLLDHFVRYGQNFERKGQHFSIARPKKIALFFFFFLLLLLLLFFVFAATPHPALATAESRNSVSRSANVARTQCQDNGHCRFHLCRWLLHC